MQRRKVLAAAVVALVLAHPAPARADDDLKTVAVVKAGYANLSRSISLAGELRPWQEIDVHAKVAGYLKDITVDIGDRVKKDQVIATLDLPEEQQDALKAQADYQVAKLDYDRLQQVMKKQPGLLAQEDLDKAQGAFGQAKAAYDRATILAAYASITAPFDAVVTKRSADPGALVQAGTSGSASAPLVHLAEIDKLRLDFPAPESVVPQVEDGMAVDVSIQSTGEKLHDKVARISDKVDAATRTMNVEVDIPNADLKLKPGMYAEATLVLASKEHALAVPVQAVSRGDKPDVWVVNKDGVIEARPVTLGLETPDAVEIIGGVQEGDELVYGSRGDLSVGMKVAPKIVEGIKG